MKHIDNLEEMINSLPPEYLLVKKALLSEVNKIKEDIADNYVLRKHSVIWSVLDFVSRAEMHGSNWREYFDETLFEKQLKLMIYKHDATVGITWDSVDEYLHNCKKVILW